MIHYVLILAGGKGTRLKNQKTPKQFLELNKLPIVMHSAIAFINADPNAQIYIALPKGFKESWNSLCIEFNFEVEHVIYIGGESRLDTVSKGLKKIHQDILKKKKINNNSNLPTTEKKKLISIHDAARPFINKQFILKLMQTAKKYGNAVPVMNLKSSLRKVSHKKPYSFGKNRNNYIITQTPQVFCFSHIYASYCKMINVKDLSSNQKNIKKSKFFFDDASVYDAFNTMGTIHLINGEEYNIKITTDLDYFLAPRIYEFLKQLK